MKYLVWDKNSKKWSQDYHYHLAPNGELYYGDLNVTQHKEIYFGSGVPDKEDNEIYNGHIIEIGNGSPPYFEVVEFKDGQYQTREECEQVSKIACKELGPGCVIVGHTLTHDITLYGVILKKE